MEMKNILRSLIVGVLSLFSLSQQSQSEENDWRGQEDPPGFLMKINSKEDLLTIEKEIKKNGVKDYRALLKSIFEKYKIDASKIEQVRFISTDHKFKTIKGHPDEKTLLRITFVKSGSFFDKEGLKVGDLVSTKQK